MKQVKVDKQVLKTVVRGAIIEGLIEHLESSKLENSDAVDKAGYTGYKGGFSQDHFSKVFYVERMKIKNSLESIVEPKRTYVKRAAMAEPKPKNGRKHVSAARRLAISKRMKAYHASKKKKQE